MADRNRSWLEELERALLSAGSTLPTTALGRLRRTVGAAFRGGRLAWNGRGGEDLDLEALGALVGSVGQLKGIAMKAGQMLSYLDLPLPQEVKDAFSALQTHSASLSFEEIAALVRAELDDRAEPLLAKMTREPVAAASIGQVHRSTLPSGEQVAVKVQYPGIDKAIAADFRAAGAGTHFIQLLAPGAGVPGVLREARAALLEECDYQREARYQDRFAQVYAGHPTLWVPPTYGEYGSRRVLTTRWVDGLRLEAFIATQPSQDQRDRVGRALFEFYVGTLFRHRLYNWDPHPGNYLFLSDGKLAMLDYGSTRDFDAAFVKKLAALTLAVHADRPSVLHAALADLAMVSDFGDYDYETARSLVRSFFGPMLKDDVVAVQRGEARPLKDVMASKRQLLKLHLPAQIVFILRIRYGLMAVLAQLGARANWYQMERSWAEHAVS